MKSKPRRPVPEAIPIETHLNTRSYNGHPPPPPPLIAYHPQLRRSIPNLRKFSNDSQEYYNTAHRQFNGYDDSTPSTAVYVEDDCDYYSDSETIEAALTGRPVYAYNNDFYSRQEAQMGLHSLLNKFTHFFNWNPSTNHYNTAQREGKRKRRSDESYAGAETSGPQQIKYRKVENRFPKYIAAGSHEEDDVSEFLPPQQIKSHNKEYLLNNSAQRSRTLLEMSNRRSSSSMGKKFSMIL